MEDKKIDIRIVKTKRAIKNTFLEMRKTIPLEKIRVRDICSRALINKSTFYCHYADAFALSDEMEDEAIAAFLDRFDAKDCLFSDPERFLSEMPEIFDANMELLMPLFRDRMDTAFMKLKAKLKERYLHPDMTPEEDIRITFAICGTLYTFRELKFEKRYASSVLTDGMTCLLSKIK